MGRKSKRKGIYVYVGFPGGSGGKESTGSVGDPDLIPGSRGPPGGGTGSPLQYSCLENSMDRGAEWANVHGVTKRWTRTGDFHFFHVYTFS